MTEWEAVAINLAWWISLWVILEYFWMSQEALIILTVMLLLDRIFWVIDAYIQETLQSKLMVTWLVKKLTRRMLPFIVIAIMRWAGFENIDLIATIILSILIVAEGYSVVWHIYSINYWEQIMEIDALKLMFEWIANLLRTKIDETLPPKKKNGWKESGSTESWETI